MNQLGWSYLYYGFNAFTTENPFLGTKLLGISVGKYFGAVKGFVPDSLQMGTPLLYTGMAYRD